MAVVEAKRIRDGRGSTEGGVDPVTAREVWRITVDSPLDNRATILTALPSIFASHDSDPGLTLRSATLDHTHKLVWLATLEYSNAPLEDRTLERLTQANPTLRTPRIRWRTNTRQIVATRDADGRPYVNSAGDQLDAEARLRDVTDIVVRVSKSVADLPPWILTLNNTMNAGPFTVRGVTFPAYTLLLRELEIGDESTENDFPFVQVDFELHYHYESWIRFELDRGYRRRKRFDTGTGGTLSGTTFTKAGENFTSSGVAAGDILVVWETVTAKSCVVIASVDSDTQLTLATSLGSGTVSFATASAEKRVLLENDDGTRPTDPVLLDGCGGELVNPSDTNAVYLQFVDYAAANYAALNTLVQ